METGNAFYSTPPIDSFHEYITPKNNNIEWHANSGDQTFSSDTCWGWIVTIQGDSRDNRIKGTAFNDVIHGGDGDDRIFGRGGNDVICGGRGNDRLSGNKGHDVLLGDVTLNRTHSGPTDSGQDRIFGGDGVDTLYGGSGADVLRGGRGNDFLSGDDGDDDIDGQSGKKNVVRGGNGLDRCVNYQTTESCEE